MRSVTTDFYLNLDRWEAIATIERDRGRWEARNESPPARLDPILREALFQSAFVLTGSKDEPTEKARRSILSPSPPQGAEGPIPIAWRYARAVQFTHGWQRAFNWTPAGMAQIERIFSLPESTPDQVRHSPAERILELREQAAMVGQNAGGVGLIEIGTFIGGMRQILGDDPTDTHLYMIALRMLVLQRGYLQILFAPLERAYFSSAEGSVRGGPPEIGVEPVGLWLDEAIAILLEVGRMAERAWEAMRVAAPRSALQEQILSFAQRNGKLTAGEVMVATGANRNTIKDNLARLVEEGVLVKRGIKRGTVYIPC
jgi:hypothetical protein